MRRATVQNAQSLKSIMEMKFVDLLVTNAKFNHAKIFLKTSAKMFIFLVKALNVNILREKDANSGNAAILHLIVDNLFPLIPYINALLMRKKKDAIQKIKNVENYQQDNAIYLMMKNILKKEE